MSIEKMELVNVAGLLPDLDKVLRRCCRSNCFHIEQASHDIGEGKGFEILQEENPYVAPLKRLYSLAASLNYKLQSVEHTGMSAAASEELGQYVANLEEKFKSLKVRIRELSSEISVREQALIQVRHLKGLNVDFQRIFACKHIGVRFGKLPIDSYGKLAYYDSKDFIFTSYEEDQNFIWGCYFMPDGQKKEIDDIFDSLYFERVRVPDFVRGTADEAISDLTASLSEQKKELEECQGKMVRLIDEEEDELNKVFSRLKFLHDTFALRSNASVYHDKFYLVGFVPQNQAKDFLRLFDDMKTVSVLIHPPELDARLKPPTKLKNNRFAEPFTTFVEMYGLPAYNGFNPTMLVALTYTLLFGIMFGDLGQGLVVCLAGLFLSSKMKIKFGRILTRIGISSAFFGLIYGSVFGFEEALNPLYKLIGLKHKPLEVFQSTTTILLAAVGIGAVLILVVIGINIYIGFKHRDFERAIFGNNGICGFVLYGSLMAGLVGQLMLQVKMFTAPYILLCIVLPAVLIFFRIPLSKYFHSHKSYEEEGGTIGNFIAENFFELFEYVLSYVTNTMSFLRVGGFVLSHAGMMLVVMTLADMVSAGVSPVVVVLGNIFVMGMEGMIVGIQVLRLEFYELFSRFYDGDGHPFQPVQVDYDTSIE